MGWVICVTNTEYGKDDGCVPLCDDGKAKFVTDKLNDLQKLYCFEAIEDDALLKRFKAKISALQEKLNANKEEADVQNGATA